MTMMNEMPGAAALQTVFVAASMSSDTALFRAAQYGLPEPVLTTLIADRGADVNAFGGRDIPLAERDPYRPHVISERMSALEIAAKNRHLEAIRVLAEHGATDRDERALAMAYNYDDPKILFALNKESITKPSIPRENHLRDIERAACSGKINLLRTFLARGDSVSEESALFKMPLLHNVATHAKNGLNDVIDILIDEAGIDVNGRSSSGYTALHCAMSRSEDDDKVIHKLIEKGAEVDSTAGPDKQTSLHFAAGNGHPNMAHALIGYGANIDFEDSKRRTPLHRAAEAGHLSVVRLLIERGAKTDIKDALGKTALDYALDKHHTKVVDFLVDGYVEPEKSGALSSKGIDKKNIPEYPKYGFPITPLHDAMLENDMRMVRIHILEEGADLEIKNERGQTPLQFAAERGLVESVDELTSYGADISALDFRKINQTMTAKIKGMNADITERNSSPEKFSAAIKALPMPKP